MYTCIKIYLWVGKKGLTHPQNNLGPLRVVSAQDRPILAKWIMKCPR